LRGSQPSAARRVEFFTVTTLRHNEILPKEIRQKKYVARLGETGTRRQAASPVITSPQESDRFRQLPRNPHRTGAEVDPLLMR
jgi:hypothetical protein